MQFKTGSSNARLIMGVSFLGVILTAVIAFVLWKGYLDARDAADQAAIQDADKVVNSFILYRNFYTKIVVPRAKEHNIVFTHDYKQVTNALPLPATFIIDFGQLVTAQDAIKIRLFSDKPFPWRGEQGGAHDDFEIAALKHAQEYPDQPFWRIETDEGERVLRYAKPDRLSSEVCVSCHNTYPGSPKTDWKQGDVRGVFSFTRPLTLIEGGIQQSYVHTLYAVAAVVLVLIILLYVLIGRLRNSLTHAENKSDALQEEMMHREQLNRALISEQDKTRSIFASVIDGIIVINQRGIIQDVNDATTTLLGYSRESLIGNNISMIMPEPHRSNHDHYILSYFTTGEAKIIAQVRQLQAAHLNGDLIDIDLSVNTVFVGEEEWFVGVIRDIRLRLASERALQKEHDSAMEIAKVKSQFLANMSHELRTPLNGMMSMSQLLEEDLVQQEYKSRASIIHSSAKQLLHIVNDILDFSRIESGKFVLHPKPFDLQKWLLDTLAIHLQVAHDKQLTVQLIIDDALPEQVCGDALRLSQIVNNLMSNALKFTQQGGVVLHLKGQSLVENAFAFQLAVKDTGSGLSADNLLKLFKPFSQADNSATRQHGGTGLGLVISQQLAMLMQGDILVDSIEDEGSTFTLSIQLPACTAARRDGVSQYLNQVSDVIALMPVSVATGIVKDGALTNAIRVLVVEDNVVNQKVVTAILKRFGCHITVVNNGREAFDNLKQHYHDYDVVLMDCQMPELDGYGATSLLREWAMDQGIGYRIPVIALTAHAMEGEAEKCFASGMDDYMTKPLDHALLKEKLDYWYKKSQSNEKYLTI